MDEVYEGECDSRIDSNPEIPYPINLKAIYETLVSINKPLSEAEAKALLAPLEDELNRRTCGLVWKQAGETINILESIGDNLPIFTPCPEMTIKSDKGPDHVLIEGENLLALMAMQYTHIEDRHGLIDIIYIDPPYNTQNIGFAYNDRFPKSEWLTMMDARSRLAWYILKDDGILYVSIDGNYLCECKLMLDDIFGHPPLSIICVEVSKTMGMRIKSAKEGNITKNHEYVLVYVKKSKFAFEDRKILYDKAEIYDSHYKLYMDEKLEPRSLVDVIREDPHLSSMFQKYGIPIKIEEIGRMMSIDKSFRKWIYDNADFIYQTMAFNPDIPENVIKELKEKPVVQYGKYLLRLTTGNRAEQYAPLSWALRTSDDYNPEFGRVTIRGSLWKGFYSDMMNVGKEGGVPFKNAKKPKRLIKQLLKWANRPNGIILDFFAGSGTTLHSVLELNAEDGGNRQCILCTNNELGKEAENKARKANATDREKEKFGVCQSVTWPRIKAILTGETPNDVKIDATYPDNSLFTYKINEEIAELIANAQTEQRKNDLMTVYGVSYIALKEGFFRSEAGKDWHLLWKDNSGVIVITNPDLEMSKIIRADWSDIAGKEVKKVYCSITQEKKSGETVYVPYPKAFLEILKSVKRRLAQ